MRYHSYENDFHLHVHFHVNQTHFHLNGFARRLVLKLRQKATRKWPNLVNNRAFHHSGVSQLYRILGEGGRGSCKERSGGLTREEVGDNLSENTAISRKNLFVNLIMCHDNSCIFFRNTYTMKERVPRVPKY